MAKLTEVKNITAYQLELDEIEARTLQTILSNVSGDCTKSLRSYADQIFNVLEKNGVKSYSVDQFLDANLCEIRFLEKLPKGV